LQFATSALSETRQIVVIRQWTQKSVKKSCHCKQRICAHRVSLSVRLSWSPVETYSDTTRSVGCSGLRRCRLTSLASLNGPSTPHRQSVPLRSVNQSVNQKIS